MQSIPVLQLSSHGWELEHKPMSQHLNDCNAPKLQYLFLKNDMFSTGLNMLPELVQHFQIPQRLLSDVYRRSNGFFLYEEKLDTHGRLENCYVWFRILVKAMSRDGNLGYTWHVMTFCSRWDAERCSILCIGIDCSFQKLLRETLSRIGSQVHAAQLYSLHIPIIETIIAMQDIAVWSVRDFVRNVEQGRSYPTGRPHDFLSLHEVSRHAIHSIETLNVAIETVSAIRKHASSRQTSETTAASQQVELHLDFQIQALGNLLLRSQSNKERLQNEIALAHNMIAQQDSAVMKTLAAAAKRDSSAMRTIAVVTMAFLPPTLLSAIFSMSFFNYAPGQGSNGAEWSVSGSFWIYWACAVPLTCLTLAIWFWQRK